MIKFANPHPADLVATTNSVRCGATPTSPSSSPALMQMRFFHPANKRVQPTNHITDAVDRRGRRRPRSKSPRNRTALLLLYFDFHAASYGSIVNNHASSTTEIEDYKMSVPLSIMELEEHAKKTLNKMTWEYYFHGAAEEITRLDNIEAFNRYFPGDWYVERC